MNLMDYVNRHKELQMEVDNAATEINKVAAKHFLNVNDVVWSEYDTMSNIRFRLQKIFAKMYTKDIYKDICEIGEDFTINNILWESSQYQKSIKNYGDVKSRLINGNLICNGNLRYWLLKFAHNDSNEILGIIRKIAVDDMCEKKVEETLNYRYKVYLNKLKRLIDAIAYTSLFLVRDKMMSFNDVGLMRWSSIFDSGGKSECYNRDGLLYYVKTKKPYMHNIGWKPAGCYHWGCRSFMTPYE